MAVLVEFSVANDTFPLGRLATALRTASIDLERIVPTETTLFPYVWIRNATIEEVETAFDELPEGPTLTTVAELDGYGLLARCRWDGCTDGVVKAIVESPATLLSASGDSERWTFRLRFDEYDDIAAFRSVCTDASVDIAVSKLQPFTVGDETDETGLTTPQLEALGLAFERGYFDEPRAVTLDELADELGITRQSLAGRLRRGHRNLLARLFDEHRRSSDTTMRRR